MKKHSTTADGFEQLHLDFPPQIASIPRLAIQQRQYSIRAQAKRKPLAESIRSRIFAQDDSQCRYCGDPATVIEHIIPWAYGGSDEDDNLVSACVRCNLIAGDKVFDNFNEKRRYILDQRKTLHHRRKIARKRWGFCIDCGKEFNFGGKGATRFLCPECNERDLTRYDG